MRFITLELAKRHLNVEHNEDDAYIEHIITAAEQAVENYIEQPLAGCVEGGFVPAALKHAMLLVVGTLYANRESVVYANVGVMPAVSLLLQPYKKYK
jgi:hypothetical protein